MKVPIIGMGGIATADDAMEFILAGATAVSVGTANFYNPYAARDVARGIEEYMRKYQVEDINTLIGAVRYVPVRRCPRLTGIRDYGFSAIRDGRDAA